MVILSAAVTTKNGRALLSRQFVDMNRLRVGLAGRVSQAPGAPATKTISCCTPSTRACVCRNGFEVRYR